MKKLVYLLVILGASFLTGCDPLEDINNEIDAQDRPVVGEAVYTLTDEDYSELELTYGSFNSIDDAKTMLPAFLADKYPIWGLGSSVAVNFNLYKSLSIGDSEEYTVTDQDYTDAGFSYPNFDSEDDFSTFLNFKYPAAVRGDLKELTYDYYVGGGNTETRTSKIILLDEWSKTQEFSSDDYSAMGQNYPNFSSTDLAEYRIGIYLETLNPYAESGDELVTLYKFYNGDGIEDKIAPYTFDGDKWNLVGSVVESTLKFGHNGTQWVPDNTIRYTMVGTDYSYVSGQLIAEEGFEGPADSMGNYGNFDRRPSNDNYWSDEMIVRALDILLDNNDPNAEEGQKYVVTFAIYDGSNGTESFSLIKENGEWVVNAQ